MHQLLEQLETHLERLELDNDGLRRGLEELTTLWYMQQEGKAAHITPTMWRQAFENAKAALHGQPLPHLSVTTTRQYTDSWPPPPPDFE